MNFKCWQGKSGCILLGSPFSAGDLDHKQSARGGQERLIVGSRGTLELSGDKIVVTLRFLVLPIPSRALKMPPTLESYKLHKSHVWAQGHKKVKTNQRTIVEPDWPSEQLPAVCLSWSRSFGGNRQKSLLSKEVPRSLRHLSISKKVYNNDDDNKHRAQYQTKGLRKQNNNKKKDAETFHLNSMERRDGHNPQICYWKTIHSTSLAILSMIKKMKSKLIHTNLQNG